MEEKMKLWKTFAIPCLGSILTLFSVSAFGQDVVYKEALGLVWPVRFPQGEATAGASSTTIGFVVNVPMKQGWVWYSEAGFSTPNILFTPSPRVALGPAYAVSENLIVGLAGSYQYNPSHGRTDWSHNTGGSAFLCIPLSKEISTVFSFGGGKSLRENGEWFLSFQPRLMLRFPF
jgi:hypothetical protein